MSSKAKFNDSYQAYLQAEKQKRSETNSQLQDLELTNETKSTDFSNAGPCNARQQN